MYMSKENIKKDDRRTIRTKRDLANALFELLQEKNLDDITVQDITDRALISKTTFYNNFNDKSELLTFLLRRSIDDVLEKIELSNRNINPVDFLNEVISHVVDFLIETALPFKKMIAHDKSGVLYYSLTRMIEGVFTSIVEQNELKIFKNHLDNDTAIYYYAGAFANLIYKKIANTVNVDRDKLIKEIYNLSKVVIE